ncbi:hypothetical protein SD71_16015 [Cohnella kolymensis]|uniref:Uncharacterized protein n=2 Tax=Cohnella kolymensis TaxID=1590652 RepID=A0ABR5A3C7_9BACL|nr:hypothetical protein SD71_16015 [Cohnella kolymensis]
MYIFEDPRPELPDSPLWKKLLRTIPTLKNKETAELLQRRLWTLRSVGTFLKAYSGGLRFVPIIGPTGAFDYDVEFDEMKRKYLAPYATEIAELLRKVNGHE